MRKNGPAKASPNMMNSAIKPSMAAEALIILSKWG